MSEIIKKALQIVHIYDQSEFETAKAVFLSILNSNNGEDLLAAAIVCLEADYRYAWKMNPESQQGVYAFYASAIKWEGDSHVLSRAMNPPNELLRLLPRIARRHNGIEVRAGVDYLLSGEIPFEDFSLPIPAWIGHEGSTIKVRDAMLSVTRIARVANALCLESGYSYKASREGEEAGKAGAENFKNPFCKPKNLANAILNGKKVVEVGQRELLVADLPIPSYLEQTVLAPCFLSRVEAEYSIATFFVELNKLGLMEEYKANYYNDAFVRGFLRALSK